MRILKFSIVGVVTGVLAGSLFECGFIIFASPLALNALPLLLLAYLPATSFIGLTIGLVNGLADGTPRRTMIGAITGSVLSIYISASLVLPYLGFSSEEEGTVRVYSIEMIITIVIGVAIGLISCWFMVVVSRWATQVR